MKSRKLPYQRTADGLHFATAQSETVHNQAVHIEVCCYSAKWNSPQSGGAHWSVLLQRKVKQSTIRRCTLKCVATAQSETVHNQEVHIEVCCYSAKWNSPQSGGAHWSVLLQRKVKQSTIRRCTLKCVATAQSETVHNQEVHIEVCCYSAKWNSPQSGGAHWSVLLQRKVKQSTIRRCTLKCVATAQSETVHNQEVHIEVCCYSAKWNSPQSGGAHWSVLLQRKVKQSTIRRCTLKCVAAAQSETVHNQEVHIEVCCYSAKWNSPQSGGAHWSVLLQRKVKQSTIRRCTLKCVAAAQSETVHNQEVHIEVCCYSAKWNSPQSGGAHWSVLLQRKVKQSTVRRYTLKCVATAQSKTAHNQAVRMEVCCYSTKWKSPQSGGAHWSVLLQRHVEQSTIRRCTLKCIATAQSGKVHKQAVHTNSYTTGARGLKVMLLLLIRQFMH